MLILSTLGRLPSPQSPSSGNSPQNILLVGRFVVVERALISVFQSSFQFVNRYTIIHTVKWWDVHIPGRLMGQEWPKSKRIRKHFVQKRSHCILVSTTWLFAPPCTRALSKTMEQYPSFHARDPNGYIVDNAWEFLGSYLSIPITQYNSWEELKNWLSTAICYRLSALPPHCISLSVRHISPPHLSSRADRNALSSGRPPQPFPPSQ